jgi:hypothetical protein
MAKSPKTGEKSPGPQHKTSTTAHLLETAGHHLGHADRHFTKLSTDKTAKQKALDYDHGTTHLRGGIEHIQKLIDHVKSNYPSEAKELAKLEENMPGYTSGVKGRIHEAVKKEMK